MASPSTVITMGYGSFGSVNLLPTLGYGSAVSTTFGYGRLEYTMPRSQMEFSMSANRLEYTLPEQRLEFTAKEN